MFRGGVSGERLHVVYQFGMEPELKPSKRGIAGAMVDLAKIVLSSEGEPPRYVESSSLHKSEKAATTQPVPEQQTNSQASSPRPVWRFGDFLLGRPSPVPEKTSENTSKKPSSSETYVEAYDESGRSYLKRVAVEG